jgi:hypothetical protein
LGGNDFEKRIRKTVSKFEETFFKETNLKNENKKNDFEILRNDLKIKRLRKAVIKNKTVIKNDLDFL